MLQRHSHELVPAIELLREVGGQALFFFWEKLPNISVRVIVDDRVIEIKQKQPSSLQHELSNINLF